ncbi:MAG: stage V sporulation protein K, partial [Cohnella sp.]|nr:stage V sporulation protein K [Cohnella sp.]
MGIASIGKAIIRFLVPEIQIVQLLKEIGFIAKEDPVRTEGAKAGAPVESDPPVAEKRSSSQRSQGVSNRKASGKVSQTRYQIDVTLSQKQPEDRSPSGKRGAKDLDQIFRELTERLNRAVVGQQSYVADLIAAYKQGYMNVRDNAANNVVLVAGAGGTGKRTALSTLVEGLHEHGLTERDTFMEIDLSRYDSNAGLGNFVEDIFEAFHDDTGTVVFSGLQGLDTAKPEIVEMVTQL